MEAIKSKGSIMEMTADDMLHVIEKQAADGADFMTLHCGITMESIGRLRQEGRVMDIVSRGGSFLTGWMPHNGKKILYMSVMMTCWTFVCVMMRPSA